MAEDDKILEALKRRNPPGTELTVSRRIPGFLDGDLVVADVIRNGEKIDENFYYSNRSNDAALERSFTSMDELALWIGQQGAYRPDRRTSLLMDFRIVSAVIAIFITITLCIVIGYNQIWMQTSPDVPDVLSNALTTILGFYFGSQVARTRTEDGAAA
jgi:hypothetical protein